MDKLVRAQEEGVFHGEEILEILLEALLQGADSFFYRLKRAALTRTIRL